MASRADKWTAHPTPSGEVLYIGQFGKLLAVYFAPTLYLIAQVTVFKVHSMQLGHQDQPPGPRQAR